MAGAKSPTKDSNLKELGCKNEGIQKTHASTNASRKKATSWVVSFVFEFICKS